MGVAKALEELVRTERRLVLASLARRFGDLDLAEEAVDLAIEAAVTQWPASGVPPVPGAWLFRAATNKATDLSRHRAMAARHHADLAHEPEEPARSADETSVEEAYPDDQIRLLFTCCHPAIAEEAQIALALRLISGLATGEVARAFLVSETTMAQRLVRAKAKIKAARIPYEVPGPDDWVERLGAVISVVYLVFNEGYVATSGEALSRVDLTEEAIRLGELLVSLLPHEAEPRALLALMLLVHARRHARSRDGDLVLLAEQDRSLWDRSAIDEGDRHLRIALEMGPPSALSIEAAIQALHDRALSHETTDFLQIARLYAMLRAHGDSPMIELNQAVAIAMVEGPSEGLRRLDSLAARGLLQDHHLYWSARGELEHRAGRASEAHASFDRALRIASNEAERRFLSRKLAGLP